MFNVLVGVLVYLATASVTAFGHGEKAAGPNGGFIQMPGAFHTELVPVDGQRIDIYLLDFDFKNPVTKNSSVRVEYKGATTAQLSCVTVGETHFQCSIPKGIRLSQPGTILVTSRRDGKPGATVKYQLPLRLAEGHP